MFIADLVKKYEKYGLDRRTIDYYSSKDKNGNRLIPCEDDEKTGYRIYNEKSEEVIKKMIILRNLGLSSQKIKTCIVEDNFTTAKWNEHIENLEKKLSEIQEMIQYAKDMRDSNSITLKMNSVLSDDDPQIELAMKRIFAHVFARIYRYLASPNELQKKSFELSDEISNFTSQCAGFLEIMLEAMEEGTSPNSEEVQNYISRFLEKLANFYGIAVYLLYDCVREIDPISLGLNKEDTEVYIEVMDAIGICAKWFKTAKTLKQIQKYDLFKTECAEEIRRLDEQVGDGTADDLIDLIHTIASIPSQITELELDRMFSGYIIGVENAEKGSEKENAADEIEVVKSFGKFLFDGMKYYVSKSRETE